MTNIKKAAPGAPECFFAGLNVVDVLASCGRTLEADKKIPADRIMVDGGGPCGNAACACAKAGAAAALVSVIGRDEWTEFSLSSLQSFGVNTALVRVTESFRTPVSVIIVNPATAERTILWNSGGINDFDFAFTPAETETLLNAPLVQFDGHLMKLAHALAPQIRARGGVVCYDCGSPKPGWEKLAESTDYFIASHAFAQQLGVKPEQLTSDLKKRFGFNVAITVGSSGYYYFDDQSGTVKFAPQKKFYSVDTTGCGDAFHGSFAAALARGKTFRAALDFAQEFAGRKSQGYGGRASLPDLKAL